MESTTLDLDLQILESPKARVRMPNGDVVEVEAPSLNELLSIVSLASKMRAVDLDNMDENALAQALNEFQEGIEKVIPAIKGRDLNLSQLMALVETVSSLATPADVKELEKRNITPATDMGQKKTQESFPK